MKRFIKQLSIFMTIFITALSLYLTFVIRFNVKTIENFRFHKGINKIIAGDSRTQYSINDKILPNTINISQNSEGLLYSYFKLKTLLLNNPQIDTVFLGVSYHNFSYYYNDIHRVPDVTSRYFFILAPFEQIRLLMDTKNSLPMIQQSIIAGTKNWIRNTPDYAFLGGFESYSTNILLSDSFIVKRINSQYFDDGKLYDFFEENIIYFGKIAKMCKEMNVTLIVLNTPMHPGYKEKVPPKFVNEFYSLVKIDGITIIEFNDLKLSDNDFLPDGDHLQESGARLATLYLNELINKSGKH